MKTLKRPLSILLSVLMVVSLFTVVPITASADEKDAPDYFVVGDFSEWQTDNMYKMTLNAEAQGTTEYMLADMVLEPTYGMKVKDSAGNWYPDPADNFSVAESATYTIYFRPGYDGGDDWYCNCLLAVKQEEPAPADPDQEAADAVTALINALPANVDDITLDNKSAIYDAYNAYEALTDAQKDLVSDDDVNKLIAARDRVDDLQVVAGFVTMLSAIPNPVTLNDENTVNLIKTVYDALTDAQKALVPADELAKLTNALDSIANQKAAKTVTDQINALPAQITLGNKSDVAAARDAYDALTDAQKAFVPAAALAKLVAAEKTIEDIETAANVTALINAIPANVTPTDAEQVENARAAYDALSTDQKALVSADTVAKLEAAEKSIADQIAAADVAALINAIPDDVTTDNVDAIEAAKEGYDALTDDQKALIDDALVTKLNDAVAKIADLTAANNVATMINALNDPATETDKDAVDAARAAYDALTDAQKNLVPADVLAKLVAAEKSVIDYQAANVIIGLINDLPAPEDVTLADAEAIQFARTAYNGLTPDQQEIVGIDPLKKLTDDENMMNVIPVLDKINALPENITLEDKADVEAARAAYEALSSDEKTLVDDETLAILIAAEKVIADYEAANPVIEQIEALPDPITLENKDQVKAAKQAFDALTNDQKALVGEDLINKLNDAVKAIADIEAVLTVYEMIKALPKVSEVTIDDADSVYATNDAFNALTDDQKNLIPFKDQVKLAAEVVLIDNAVKAAEDLAAAASVSDLIRALPAPTAITTADKDAVDEAAAAYDALTEDQKALVPLADWLKLTADKGALDAAIQTAEDLAAADAVEAMIEALPAASAVTIDDKAAVDEAKAAYDALTDNQKKLVVLADRVKLAAVVGTLAAIEDKLAAANVEAMIEALPDSSAVTIDDKAAIEEAAAAYNALTTAQKLLVPVSDTAKLVTDVVALEKIENDIAAAQAVTDMITELPAAEDVVFEDKDAIDGVRIAYDDLTDEQKALVPDKAVQKLDAVEAALAEIEEVQYVVDAINNLPAKDEITYADKGDVVDIRAAYDALSDEQKAQISDETLQKLTDAEEVIAKIDEDIEAAAAVEDLIDALPNPLRVSIDDKEAIEAAQAAYDALTPEQQERVGLVEKAKLAADTAIIKQLEEDIAAAQAVSDMIQALPAVEDLTYADKDAVEAARAAFDDLTFIQKLRVGTESYNKLLAAEERIAGFVLLGDANGDGVINVVDLTTIQRHIAEAEILTGDAFNAADVNRDGAVTIDDATILQMFLAEMEVEYPIGEMA